MKRMLAVAVTLCAVAAAAYSEDTCPALDRARASALLGAEAQLSVEWQSAHDYTCTYTAGASTLRIVIGAYHARQGWPTYTARCLAQPETLTGVGNEAVACYLVPQHQGQSQGEVIAHVTDTLLDLTLTQPAAGPDALKETLRHAAERVAGNFF